MESAYPPTPGAQNQSTEGDDDATLTVHALVYPNMGSAAITGPARLRTDDGG
jgi:hypothetical protein